MQNSEDVMLEVLTERIQQIDKGYTPTHDAEHGPIHVFEQVWQRMPQIDWVGGEPAWTLPSRQTLIEMAALLVATIEVLDA